MKNIKLIVSENGDWERLLLDRWEYSAKRIP